MKRSATRFFAAAATIILAAGITCSCHKSGTDVDNGPATLEVDVSTVNFTEENASNRTIMVKSNVAWDYTVSDGWLHAEKQPDRLIISAEDNDQKNIRRATVTITVPDLPAHTVEVQQLGWGKAILLSQSTATVSAAGGDITVEVTTNVEVEAAVGPDCTWIYETPIDTRSAAHPVVTSTRAFSVSGNTADGTRSATITFSDKQTPSDVEAATLTVTQRGLDAYAPESTESLKDDIKLIIARELSIQPSLLVAMQPTRGLDIGASAYVHEQLMQSRERGSGIILISTDLEEILALSDRIAVMFGGRIMGIVPNTDALQPETLGMLMGGHTWEEVSTQ